mgnify:CR=1 FL=1
MKGFLAIGSLAVASACASPASAQEALEVYDVDGEPFGLFGYYTNGGKLPHFLAMFRPSESHSIDASDFNYQAACEAVLASPPDVEGAQAIEPEGAVIVFQIVKTRLGIFGSVRSTYGEFDVEGSSCRKHEGPPLVQPFIVKR